MRLRIKPTDDCIIQKLDCDGNWQDWFDSRCGQDEAISTALDEFYNTHHIQYIDDNPPANGSGSCVEYDLQLDPKGQILLPVVVDAGDTIQVLTSAGAATDGAGLLGFLTWYCTSGKRFLGNIVGNNGCEDDSELTDDLDPLPTAPHMCVIANINGIWYEMINTIITVPAGINRQLVSIGVNDHELPDNSGSYSIRVRVCKSSTASWVKIFDFAGGDQQGWSVFDGLGSWNGHGFDAVQFGGYTACILSYPGPNPVTVTKITVLGYISGTSTDGNTSAVFDVNGGTHNSTEGIAGTSGGDVEDSIVDDITSIQHVLVRMNGAGTGHIDIIRIFGTGVNPFE